MPAPIKNDHCGFGCKLRNFANKQISSQREKKAKSYGFDSYSEWSDAAEKAKKTGLKKRGKSRLKEIEKEYSGGTSKTSKAAGAWAAFDAFMGTPSTKKTRKTKRKTSGYVVVGGKAYKKGGTKRTTKRKTAKEEPFFTF